MLILTGQMRAWRKNLLRIGLGSAATGAFLWLFLREVDLRLAWNEITALPGWTMAAALGLVLANVFIMAVRWRYLLEGAGYPCATRKLFSSVAVGRGANNILPARGGDLLRIESLRERQVPVFVTAGTLFAERLLDGVVLSTWILFGAIAIGQSGPMLLTGIALSSGAALGVALVLLAAREPDRAERLAWRATRRLPPRWHTRVGAFRGRKRLAAILATSAAMWLADVAMYYVVGEHAFGLDLPVGAYFLLEGIGNLALAVPATAAGIGTFDYLTLLAAKGVDIQIDKATAYVLTMHALNLLPVTLLGAVRVSPAFPRLRGRRRREAEAAHEHN